MSSFEEMRAALERALTELSTAQAAQKIILQCFLLNFARVVENPDAFVDSIKHQVLASVESVSADNTHVLEGERYKQMTLFQTEQFFLELEAAAQEAGRGRTSS